MRCFLGIGVDANVAALAARVRTTITERDSAWSAEKWVSRETLHVTVRFLGELDQAKADALSLLLEEAVRGVVPFELRCDHLGVRTTPRGANLVWLGFSNVDKGFSSLVAQVDAACSYLGIGYDERPQMPHVTLCRARRPHQISRDAVGAADALIDSAEVIVSVRSFSLFISRLAPRGPQYRTAGTWCLRGEFRRSTDPGSP